MSESAEDINFRPFTVLLGIVLGTLFSIAFGLSVVCLVFWILQDDEPRIAAEFGSLLASTGIFVVLSAIAGASFFGALHARQWRFLPLAALFFGLLITGWYYWP